MPGAIGMAEVFEATSGAALEQIAKRIPGFELPNKPQLDSKRVALLEAARKAGLLSEALAAEVVAANSELQHKASAVQEDICIGGSLTHVSVAR